MPIQNFQVLEGNIKIILDEVSMRGSSRRSHPTLIGFGGSLAPPATTGPDTIKDDGSQDGSDTSHLRMRVSRERRKTLKMGYREIDEDQNQKLLRVRDERAACNLTGGVDVLPERSSIA